MRLFKTTITTVLLLISVNSTSAQKQLLCSDKFIFTILDEDALRVFDRTTKTLVFEKSVEYQADAELCLSADGTKLWYTNDDHLFCVNTGTWTDFKEIKKDQKSFWNYYDFTFDRQFVINSKIQDDKTMISDIYSLNTGELVKSVKQDKSDFVNSAYFDPSTNYLYTFFNRKESSNETQAQNSGITSDAASVSAFQKTDGQSSLLTVINTTDNSVVFDKDLYYSSSSKILFIPINKTLYLIAPYGVGKLKSLFDFEFIAVANFDQFFIADKKMYFPKGYSMNIVDSETGTTSSIDDEEFSDVLPYAHGIDYSSSKKEVIVLTDEFEIQVFSISNLKEPISRFKIKE